MSFDLNRPLGSSGQRNTGDRDDKPASGMMSDLLDQKAVPASGITS